MHRAFLLYDCPGNIGQLRNDLKLACARAFLAGRGRPGPSGGLIVTSAMLPPTSTFPPPSATSTATKSSPCSTPPGAPAATPKAAGGRRSPPKPKPSWPPPPPRLDNLPGDIRRQIPCPQRTVPRKLGALRQNVWNTAGQKLLAVTGQVLPELTARRGGEILAVHLAAYLRDLAAAGRRERRRLPGDLPATFETEKDLAARILGLAQGNCRLAPPPDELFLLTLFLALFPAEGRALAPAGLAVMALGPGAATAWPPSSTTRGHPVVAALDIPLGATTTKPGSKSRRPRQNRRSGRGVLLFVDMQPLVLWAKSSPAAPASHPRPRQRFHRPPRPGPSAKPPTPAIPTPSSPG
jgi:hypothetical protein